MSGEGPLPFPDPGQALADVPELGTLFHRLNNQLGIILATAELLENKLPDQSGRSRAGQIVTSAVEAISTAQYIRTRTHQTVTSPLDHPQ